MAKARKQARRSPRRAKRSGAPTRAPATDGGGATIHPVVMYPFNHPEEDTRHVRRLYRELVAEVAKHPSYAEPITVLNMQTEHHSGHLPGFKEVMANWVMPYSRVVQTWSVDTCQMWLAGLGEAYGNGEQHDVYWLIPGDFHYASDSATESGTLEKLRNIPQWVNERDEGKTIEMCLGEIQVPLNSSKQLIDTYGTYGLLYNWFPAEAQGIRLITHKPRTEFFAISHSYLGALLMQRWYAYEQTIIILLHNMRGDRPDRKIRNIDLGWLSDVEAGRDSLASAMMQVERTERTLKLYWREHAMSSLVPNWPQRFSQLDRQSEQIRGAALVILGQLL